MIPVQGDEGGVMYDTLRYDYNGSYIYKDHYLNMLLTPDGYEHPSDMGTQQHYYAKDHLGNNRVDYYENYAEPTVVHIREISNYYPYGMEFNEKPIRMESTFNTITDFTYNGKEYQTMHGLNMLDYGARFYDPAEPQWRTVDPLCEKSYASSPYAYCKNNPIKYIDPDGKREWPVNSTYNGYGRRHENNFGAERPNGRTHMGVDINHTGGGNTDRGAPIVATHDGKVTRVVTIANGDKDGGGNRIQITSSDGSVSTNYMHLDAVNSGIKEGVVVVEGQRIGTMGGSGKGSPDAYTSHLHYEIKIDDVKINPATSSTNLIDPQQLITPLNGGILPEVNVIAPSPVQTLPISEIKPLPVIEIDKIRIQ